MRVGLLTREYPPDVYGGAGVYVEHLAAELSKIAEVDVHCFGDPRDDPLVKMAHPEWSRLSGGDPHVAALRTMSANLSMAEAVSDVDIVHSNTWYTNFAGFLAKLLYKVPHVATTHSLEPLRPWKAEQLGGGYELSLFCERTGLESAEALIAVSGDMRADILRCYPSIDPERVHVVHNGVDPEVYRPDPSTEALERHGIEPGHKMVIFVGRITRQKGIVHLLRAASRIAPDALLVLCAASPDTREIGEETANLVEELSRSRGNIVWIQQMLDRGELVQLLSSATVFVCPSVYEPFGIVNLEAMACETAVVATRTGGISEIVVEGETGLLVDPPAEGDSSGFESRLADAINELLSDPNRANGMGSAGRIRVIEDFSWSSLAAKTLEVYQRAEASRL